MTTAPNETILVTGGTGFVGSHCILLGLKRGYSVRTTIRNLKRTEDVKQMLRTGGATAEQADSVQFVAADLTKDDGWAEACAGCTYILHVASPFPPAIPKDENELIVPAREGTLRALKFAKQAGTVRRVVLTSSYAAVGYGRNDTSKIFTEEDWSLIGGEEGVKVPAYQKSKTIAEKAAWDWITKEGGDMDMATVNPVGIFGPVLGEDYAPSVQIVSRLLTGKIPAIPDFAIGCVDVRDVAELHFLAMTDAKASGQRYLACADGATLSFKGVAEVLKKKLSPQESKKVATRSAPNFLIKFVALFDPAIRLIVPELGRALHASNEKAKSQLGWKPRSNEEGIISCAKSLIDLGVVKI